MIAPVSSANSIQSVQPAAAAPQATAASKPQPSPVSDTVQISSAAKLALQEAIETPSQTAHKASTGDLQAKRLLAKEQASRTH